MKIIFPIFLQIITISICFIKIPLKFYPSKIFNESNPSTIFNNMVMRQLYAKIEIGTPKQTIFIPLELEKNDFYITKFDGQNLDEKYAAFNLKNFRESSSSSFYLTNEDSDGVYYGTNFVLASKAKDLFFFEDKKTELEFYLADSLTEITPGELGLQIDPIDDLNSAFDTSDKCFLKKLKRNGMINNYVWTILYNNENNNNNKDIDAYLYIGDYLHDIDSTSLNLPNIKFKKDSLTSVNSYIYQRTVLPQFEMSKLVLFRGNNPNDVINDIKYGKNYLRVKLDFNLCGIQASEIIRVYLELNIFNEENHCHKGTFKYMGDYIFYYCEKYSSSINKIKNNFPSLNFIHQDFNYNFTITAEDLIVEKNDYFYFLIFFSDYNKYEWRLGRPFVNKYNFMIDQDGKKVMFYSEKEEVSLPGVQSKSLVVLLVVLIIIFLLLGFFFGRKIYKSKFKKPINILDDNFDYTIDPNNNEIEMSKKLSD